MPYHVSTRHGSYEAEVIRVIDGDTFVCRPDLQVDPIDLGFGIVVVPGLDVSHEIHVRLKDFDAPELRSKNPQERQHAKQCKDFCINKIDGMTVEIITYKDTRSFNRWVADVFVHGESLADILRSQGFEKREHYDAVTV